MDKKLLLIPTVLAIAGLILAVYEPRIDSSSDLELLTFKEWMSRHNKFYASESERNYRMQVFLSNLDLINRHNQEYARGIHTYTMIANKFADLTDSEFKALYLSSLKPKKTQGKDGLTFVCHGHLQDVPNPPASIDWSKRATTDVIDAGSCGSNWAISTTGVIEGLYALTKGRITKFSDQQLIDCSDIYGNEGCLGGFMDQALWYVIDNGITTAEQYPYTQKDTKCLYKASMRATGIRSCAEVQIGNYTQLLGAVVSGPVAVAIDSANLRFYNDGVFNGACGTDLNSGMLLVGYGNQDGKDYWNIKNSLGPNWGRSGYMLLFRDKQDGPGKCGVQMASFVAQDIN